MRRRSRASSKLAKARSRRQASPKRPTGANQESEAARLASELSAMSEILRLIADSPSNVTSVLQSVAEQAARICQAQYVDIFLVEGDNLKDLAWFGAIKRTLEFPLDRSTVSGRSVCEMRPVSIDDLQNAGDEFARGREIARKDGNRSVLAVPLIREGRAIGTIFIRRTEIRPFEQKHISLMTAFASQAVIAIENARLLNELRQRTSDLTESLDQQTATSEVLRIISSSPGELEPVFEAMLQNSIRICEAGFGQMFLCEGDSVRLVATIGVPTALVEFDKRRGAFQPLPGGGLDQVMRTKQVASIADLTAEHASYPPARLGGARSYIAVPMLRKGALVGAIAIYRQEVRPFTDKQIELVKNFAAQAVIAIENARLLNELRESLEQQTATADVLKVISSSSGDLQPVFDAMLVSATRLCQASYGMMWLRESDSQMRVAARHGNLPEAFLDQWPIGRVFRPSPSLPTARVFETRKPVHVIDLKEDCSYFDHDPLAMAGLEVAGIRTLISVPMLKEGEVVGTLNIYRREVRPFTEKQIDLVKNFASQAVIAIENTRLLNELRQRTTDLGEALDQQTATSEVLSVISKSRGELQPVFQAMLENATRICGASVGNLLLYDGRNFRLAAMYNPTPAYAEHRQVGSVVPVWAHNPLSRIAADKRLQHIADARTEQAYLEGDPALTQLVDAAGARTLLAVPMLRENELVGVFGIYRKEVCLFTDKQIDLVKNFAAQAIIAIENARLLNELRESLQQQTATADVLKIISRSTFDLKSVLQTLVESAAKLCDADSAQITRPINGVFYRAETYGFSRAFMDYVKDMPVQADRGSLMGRVLLEGRVVHIPDVKADPEYTFVEAQKLGGYRASLGVPMLREGVSIGVLSLNRSEVRPFTDKQIELVTTFADQAVIAIENARLLNELRQRTDDLTESLEQQTATSEVLRVISSSPGELEPVFEAMLDNAVQICHANFGNLWLREGNSFRIVATKGASREYRETLFSEPVMEPHPQSAMGRIALSKEVVQIDDMSNAPTYGQRMRIATIQIAKARTLVGVPMLKDDQVIGIIAIYRREVRSFTDKQISLLKNFAAQAVIAIENARLLNELRQRTSDLTESLAQQTATSEVLSVISSSPADIQPVFEIIGERAEKLCEADASVVSIVEGELIRRASIHGVTEAGVEALRRDPPRQLTDETLTARAIRTRGVCHVADILSDPRHPKDLALLGGFRGGLAVPMVRDKRVLGAIFVARKRTGLFSDAQVQLLKTFADQAVIAIENVRLFNETKNSLEQQTATADVLKIISRSTFDLRAVLQTLVESAARFCAANKAHIIREKNEGFYTAEAFGYSQEFTDYIKDIPVKAERGSASGRALAEGRLVHIADVKTDPEYTQVEAQRLGDYRTILCVPMLREGVPIGVLTLTRSEVRSFTDKQIELVTTFADQAAIAIENVRLFDEIQDKSRQLEEASQHKSQFLANMSHELRTPLNAILGYTELMTDGAYGEPSENMLGVLKRLEANGKHLLGLINDVLDLSKIEAGQLVLELSDYCIQDIAQTVRSTLEPLAADKKLAFKVDVASQLPPGHGDGRRLTQVLINLVGNAIKFTDIGEIAIKAEAHNGSFHVSVRDTGPGISSADQARLFQEFQQADNAITRKKGGTGLGLAISKRIIEMHGGRIWVESQPGQGSTFTFTLPVIVERQVEAA